MSPIPSEVTVPRFGGGGQITVTQKPVPSPGPGELLVRVHANALCGSERSQFERGTSVTPGHEAAGVVAAAGPGATTPVGMAGAIFLMDYCGECRSCCRGATNLCQAKRGDMGFNRDGGYGVYELVPETIFFPVPAGVTPTEATLLLDIMGTGGHALRRAGLVHDDIRSVLILGAGPIGLGLLAMAKLLLGDAVPVMISDVVPYRLDLAERMGGLPILATEKSLAEGLRQHGLDAPDVAVDAAGKASVREECLPLLALGGVLVSVAHGEGLAVQSVSRDLISQERTLIGSEYFAYREMAGNLALLRTHRAYLSQIITHRFGVTDIQHAFEVFFAGQTGKVIIEQQ